VIGLVVDENGNPQQVHIVRPLGMKLDQRAIDAVRQYHFLPATYRGKPVSVEIDMEVRLQVF
jgi:periplasmic protein TonB